MKHLFMLAGSLLFSLAFFSCEKNSDNGEIDGFWQLTTITDAEGRREDVSSKQRFWSFQLDLMSMRSYTEDFTPNHREAFARFHLQNSKLILSSIYLHPIDDRVAADDSLVVDESTTIFQPFGVWGCRDTFLIQSLTSHSMQLKSSHAQLSFQKF